MARTVAIAHHRVADFGAWRSVYDTVGDLAGRGRVGDEAKTESRKRAGAQWGRSRSNPRVSPAGRVHADVVTMTKACWGG
jgi:hypothetical protein